MLQYGRFQLAGSGSNFSDPSLDHPPPHAAGIIEFFFLPVLVQNKWRLVEKAS